MTRESRREQDSLSERKQAKYKPGDFVLSSSSTGNRVCCILSACGEEYWALQLLHRVKAVVLAGLRKRDIIGFASTPQAQELTMHDSLVRLPSVKIAAAVGTAFANSMEHRALVPMRGVPHCRRLVAEYDR